MESLTYINGVFEIKCTLKIINFILETYLKIIILIFYSGFTVIKINLKNTREIDLLFRRKLHSYNLNHMSHKAKWEGERLDPLACGLLTWIWRVLSCIIFFFEGLSMAGETSESLVHCQSSDFWTHHSLCGNVLFLPHLWSCVNNNRLLNFYLWTYRNPALVVLLNIWGPSAWNPQCPQTEQCHRICQWIWREVGWSKVGLSEKRGRRKKLRKHPS